MPGGTKDSCIDGAKIALLKAKAPDFHGCKTSAGCGPEPQTSDVKRTEELSLLNMRGDRSIQRWYMSRVTQAS
ncbi:hypothetical protein CIHG_08198 [Coccidioides immitis H538.4]|uniref:Uncharacterized protein n=1 Tax=Coccidioides immitis H538.4 TaxID=396776 RepID=A0A0J8URV2_COCIT|nr:hypothetical protein CIHG_08198 [Coccidioides immitis H538.4]